MNKRKKITARLSDFGSKKKKKPLMYSHEHQQVISQQKKEASLRERTKHRECHRKGLDFGPLFKVKRLKRKMKTYVL